MKSNFLKQISRMLVFGILITGFPVRDLMAGTAVCSAPAPKTSCPLNYTFPTSCPSLQDATKKYNVSSINLNVGASGSCLSCLSSANSPSTISTYGISPLAGFTSTDATSAPMQYEMTTSNLLAAIGNYQGALQQYGTLTAVNLSILDALKNLAPNINYSGVRMPFLSAEFPDITCADNTPCDITPLVAVAPSGDFLPLTAASGYNSGQMFVNFLSGNVTQKWYQQIVVSLIIYTLLSNTVNSNTASSLTVANLQATRTVFAGSVNGPSGSPLTAAQMSGYLANNLGFQFTGGSIPTDTVSLLINISTNNWIGVYNDSGQISALVTAFNSINTGSSQFTNFFDNVTIELAAYYVKALQSLQLSSNLYMDCSLDFTTGLAADQTSVYYATTTSEVTSDLATQFVNDQIANSGATATTAVTLESTGLDNVAFSYKTGPFYFMASALSSVDAQNMWNKVCATSSSPGLLPIQNSAIQAMVPLLATQGATLSSPDNTADGAAQYGLETLEGRMQNLIIAAKAAINQPPISGISSSDAVWWSYTAPAGVTAPALTNYSWVNSYNAGAAQTVAEIVSVDRTVKVTPALLPDFIYSPTKSVPAVPATATSPAVAAVAANPDNTAFASNDHINMLMDLVKIRMAYSGAWISLSLCASQTPPPKGAGFDCTGTYATDDNFFSASADAINFLAGAHVPQRAPDIFSRHCWNDALGRAILAQVTSVPGMIFMAALMGIPAVYGALKAIRAKRIANKAAAEEKVATESTPEPTTPADLPPAAGDVPGGPGSGPGPNPVEQPINSSEFTQLEAASETAALQSQASTFNQASSPQRTQQLEQLEATIEGNIDAPHPTLTTSLP